jgi:hypothetical protein
VGIDDAGDVTVVWTSGQVAKVATRPTGGAFSAPADLSGTGADGAALAVAANGQAIATWTRNGRLQAAARRSGGSAFRAAVDVSPSGDFTPQGFAAIGPNGQAVAVWGQVNAAGGPVVRAAVRDASGAFGPAQTLSAPATALGIMHAAVDAAGVPLVVWEQWASFSHVTVQAATAAAGEPLGAGTDISPEGSFDPALALNPAGDALLTWNGPSGDGVATLGVFRSAGGPFSDPAHISPAGEEGYNAAVALDGAGDAFAAWVGFDENDDFVVRGAAYDATPPELTGVSVPATAVAGAAVPVAAAASDAWSPATVRVDFGDGATGTPGSHAYAKPGSYEVRVTATDGAGNTATATRTVAVTAPADTTQAAVDPTPPVQEQSPAPQPQAPAPPAAPRPLRVVLPAKIALAQGATSTLSGLRPGSKVTAQLRLGGKVLARLSGRADKAGQAKLKVKLAKAGKLRGKRLTLRFTVTTAAGAARVVTKSFKVG